MRTAITIRDSEKGASQLKPTGSEILTITGITIADTGAIMEGLLQIGITTASIGLTQAGGIQRTLILMHQ